MEKLFKLENIKMNEIEQETVWLTQQEMATLFNQTKQNIRLHTNNCFKEDELELFSVVKKSFTTAFIGKNTKRNSTIRI